ncbi:MAG: carboxypeptidase-like regulatory domain-containing protein [Chloroflexota bacterium]
MTNLRTTLLAAALLALIAGCASPATQATPTPSAAPITTHDAALARVILREPRLAGIGPRNSDLIGQSSWYEVASASGVGAFVVTVRIGWGDCPAGCIDEHIWHYAVGPDGTVSILSETGAPVPVEEWPQPTGAGRSSIGGTATAGPVCPVEKNPPDPACAPRPVPGAVLVIRNAAGTELRRVTTAADGTFVVDLPAGGYVVEPQQVEGLMGTAEPQSVTVLDGTASTIQVIYDTGIR